MASNEGLRNPIFNGIRKKDKRLKRKYYLKLYLFSEYLDNMMNHVVHTTVHYFFHLHFSRKKGQRDNMKSGTSKRADTKEIEAQVLEEPEHDQ